MTDQDRPDWVPDTIFYQVFPDRFANGDPTLGPPDVQPWGSQPDRDHFQGGDLVGMLQRIAYLADLGVTGLWLNPIFTAGTNHRYDTHDYLTVDPRLGDEGLLKEFVQEAHNHGIRVLLDGVFNHCGDGHWAFQDLLAKGAASPYRDWFLVRDLPLRSDPPNYQTCGGTGYLPKLNTADPQLRAHLFEVATRWIEVADIDGWRLDVPWKVPHEFWRDFRSAVKAARSDAYLVGEIWRDAAPWLDVFDGVMNYRVRDVLLDYCLLDHMDAEDAAFELTGLFRQHGGAAPWMLNLLGCHDTPRVRTVARGDEARARLAFTMLFTLPGAPLIYYGDEFGLEGDNDPDCRGAMPVTPTNEHLAELSFFKKLTQLRHEHVALRRGTLEMITTDNAVLAYRRRHGTDDLVAVHNPRHAVDGIRVSVDAPDEVWTDVLTGKEYPLAEGVLLIGRIPAATSLVLASSRSRNSQMLPHQALAAETAASRRDQ